jgi:hypothetical protein
MEFFNIVYHIFVPKFLKARKIINKWPRISPFDCPHEEVRKGRSLGYQRVAKN